MPLFVGFFLWPHLITGDGVGFLSYAVPQRPIRSLASTLSLPHLWWRLGFRREEVIVGEGEETSLAGI